MKIVSRNMINDAVCSNAKNKDMDRLAKWLGARSRNEFKNRKSFIEHVVDCTDADRDAANYASPIEVVYERG